MSIQTLIMINWVYVILLGLFCGWFYLQWVLNVFYYQQTSSLLFFSRYLLKKGNKLKIIYLGRRNSTLHPQIASYARVFVISLSFLLVLILDTIILEITRKVYYGNILIWLNGLLLLVTFFSMGLCNVVNYYQGKKCMREQQKLSADRLIQIKNKINEEHPRFFDPS